MQRWPWITMILAAVAMLSPPGLDLIQTSFYSGELLARSLNQLLLYIAIGILVAMAALEWLVRFLWARRAAKRGGA